jgi:hypothetical protein
MSIAGNYDQILLNDRYNINAYGLVVNQGATGATTDYFNTGATGATGFAPVSPGDSFWIGGITREVSNEYLVQKVLGPTSLLVGPNIGAGATGLNITPVVGATAFVQQSPKYIKYVNQTLGNTSTGQRFDVYGVATVEQSAARGHNNHPQHAGWVLHHNGYGPVTSVTVANAGWYLGSTGPTVTFTTTVGATGVITATGYAVMTAPTAYGATGATYCAVSSVVITSGGLYTANPGAYAGGATGFTNPVSVTFSKVGATGFAATGTVNLGGRFGRNLNETLIAFKNMKGDADNNSTFPNS